MALAGNQRKADVVRGEHFTHLPPIDVFNRVVAEWIRAPNTRSGVSDLVFLISVGSSPGRGTCVLQQDTFTIITLSPDGTLSHRSCELGLVSQVKEPSAFIEKRRGSPQCSWFD